MKQKDLRHILLILFSIIFCFGNVLGEDFIKMDLSDWFKRDWDNCKARTSLSNHNKDIVTIVSKSSSAYFWKIPLRQAGNLLNLKQNATCDKVEISDLKNIFRLNTKKDIFINLDKYQTVSWRWKISNTVNDHNTANSEGIINDSGDDFAAKIGFFIQDSDGDINEIAYVWTQTIPEKTVLKKKFILKPTLYRIVAHSGEKDVNTFVSESQNLYADFLKIFPTKKPGFLVGIYIMCDTDNSKSNVTTSFSDITFK